MISKRPYLLAACFWAFIAAIALKNFGRAQADPDLWMHIFFGRLAISHGPEYADSYSFTSPGHPVFNHEWLSQSAMAWILETFGEAGLCIWRWIMIAACLAIGAAICRRKSAVPIFRAIAMLSFVIVLAPGLSMRPQLFSYALLLVCLACDPRGKARYALPLIFAVWANLHGAFALGLAIWGLRTALSAASLRQGAIWIAMCALATLLNPYGAGLWLYIASELGNPLSSRFISEWKPFAFEARELAFFATSCLAAMLFLRRPRAMSIEDNLLLAAGCILGFSSVRHAPVAAIMGLRALCSNLDAAFGKDGNIPERVSKALSFAFLAASAALATMTARPSLEIRAESDPLPVRSVDFLRRNAISGNLWLPLHWGAYSIYHLSPRIKVSIDGRWATAYPLDVMEANMRVAYEGENGEWKKILDRYQADALLVEAGNPALEEMRSDPDWAWVIGDREGGLLLRKSFLAQLRLPLLQPPPDLEPDFP